MPFITPDTLPGATQCRELVVPDNDACNAAIIGAIYELTRPYSWEQRGGASVADTTALFQTMFDTFSQLPECSAGGAVDYEKHADITLSVDATTYTLSDLDLLSGRDLRIETLMVNTGGGRRNLSVVVNGLTTAIYEYQYTLFGTAAGFTRSTATAFSIGAGTLPDDTPQEEYGYVTLDIPRWKDTDRFPVILAHSLNDINTGLGKCLVHEVDSVQSITFSVAVNDLKQGSHIVVYSRG